MSKMTYKLSIAIYLNNKRVLTEFSMQKISDVSLYNMKRKVYMNIKKILEMDYDNFYFVKLEAEIAYKGLLTEFCLI
jgi:CMP-N-acetylneuraminic acid synthetase